MVSYPNPTISNYNKKLLVAHEDELRESLSRIELTCPLKESLLKLANYEFQLGFLDSTKHILYRIYDLKLLNQVLEEKGLEWKG